MSEWNVNTFAACTRAAANTLRCSRILAMTHLAMHDAVNSVQEKYRRYVTRCSRDRRASPVAAAASAAHGVLVGLLPAQQAELDAQLAASLATVTDETAKSRGVLLGERAAQDMLALRLNDGSEIVGTYEFHSGPGAFQLVPPQTTVTEPIWQHVLPFVLESASQFRADPPLALDSVEYADELNELKADGASASSTRTQEQTDIAHYWYEASTAGWDRIARNVVADEGTDIYDTARAFALLNMAMADGFIAGWDTKMTYNFWRPYTAIRNADIDGNPATEADPGWTALRITPAHPDHVSTHSVLGAAAAHVLTRLFGDVTFSMASPTAIPADSVRTFTSFADASVENLNSRVWAGIHFRTACEDGALMGDRIGKFTMDHFLAPVSPSQR